MKGLRKFFLLALLLFLTAKGALWLFNSNISDLTVIGPIKMFDGIGRQSVELIDCLYDELKINCIKTNKAIYKDVPKHIEKLIKKSNKKLGKVVIYEAPLPMPNNHFYKKLNRFLHGAKNKDQIRIAYSLIESSAIPKLWAEALNSHFDAVVVADPYYIDIYKNSGVEIPIFVLPLGLNLDPFLTAPLKSRRNHPFCFLNVSSMIPRKNHETLIRAFHQAFKDNPDVILKMNYRSTVDNYAAAISSLVESMQATNIFLSNKPLDNLDYLTLFQQADALVTVAKGEGFSIQPREAMSLGLPVIISDNTAHKTIVESGLALCIACPKSEPAYNPYLKCLCGEEFVAGVDETAAAMRELYENYEQHLEMSAERRQWAARYQFANLKPLYLNLVKPLKIILTDYNEITEEGLYTSSVDLYNKYMRLFSCTN